MRVVALLLVVAFCAAGASARYLSNEEYGTLFLGWVQEHNRTYATPDEFQYRFQVWRDNMDFVIGYNQKNSTATMAMNQFGDMTREEFGARNGFRPRLGEPRHEKFIFTEMVATQVDWRTSGAVTPVQNQGSCGSCWAFSACASTESAYYLKNKVLTLLSPQELVNCVTKDAGCQGGLMDDAFSWMISNKGIASWASVPYKGVDGKCPSPLPAAAARITAFHDVPTANEVQLRAAIAQQPVSVAIEADQAVFQFYSSGVINDASCGTTLDHGVLVVGYNMDASPPYYIVKNSWGTSWGMQGYVNIAAGVAPKNQCGIAMMPSYPDAAAAADVTVA